MLELGSLPLGAEIMRDSVDVVEIMSRFTITLAPLGALLAVIGMESEGAMVILFCCILDRKKAENIYEKIRVPLIFESSLVWIIFTSMEGIDQLNWVQTCCVFGAVFSISPPSNSNLMQRFQISHALMFCSLSQLVLFGMLQNWTIELVITSLLTISFIFQAGLNEFVTGSIWGIFFGFRATIIALGGGVMVNDYLIVDESHRTWIMMLSAPVLGVAIFETLRDEMSDEEE